MATYTVLGIAGAPMRPPWGSFAGKPPSSGRVYTQTFTVMRPIGAPMMAPYGSFAGKPPSSGGGGTTGAGPIFLPDKSVSLDNIILGRYRKRRILNLSVDPPF